LMHLDEARQRFCCHATVRVPCPAKVRAVSRCLHYAPGIGERRSTRKRNPDLRSRRCTYTLGDPTLGDPRASSNTAQRSHRSASSFQVALLSRLGARRANSLHSPANRRNSCARAMSFLQAARNENDGRVSEFQTGPIQMGEKHPPSCPGGSSSCAHWGRSGSS
jgi:hypothetical protein